MRVSPVPALDRVATENFTFQGLDIPGGTHITLFLTAANTDSYTFSDAPLDITAQRAAQLAFGSGSHYCLGA